MSSILKALKRLEEDKAVRLDAPVDIARDILRQPRKTRHPASRQLLVPVVGGLVVAVGALFLLQAWHSTRASEPVTQAEPAVSQPQPPPSPAVAPIEVRANALPAVSGEPEIVEVQMSPPPVAAAVERAARPAGAAAGAVAPPKALVPPPDAKPAPAATVEQAALPPLAVSGIAFQTEREARLAVVNDLPVMEGTLIEGARVEEILADRVRFAWEGGTFEVLLGEKE